jgi:CRP-like cAMP-binding protein
VVLSELASRVTAREHARGAVVAAAQCQLEELLLVREGVLVCGAESAGPGGVFGQLALAGPLVLGSSIVALDGASVLHLPAAAVVDSIHGWLDGFATLDELARRPSTAAWQM